MHVMLTNGSGTKVQRLIKISIFIKMRKPQKSTENRFTGCLNNKLLCDQRVESVDF